MVGKATDTRLQILEFIVDYLDEHRYAPTREEMCEAVGLKSKSAVQYHVDSLIDTGHLEKSRYRHRILRPTDAGRAVIDTLRTIDETNSRT